MLNNIKITLISLIGYLPYLILRGIFNLKFSSIFSIIYIVLFIFLSKYFENKNKKIEVEDESTISDNKVKIKNNFIYILISSIIISVIIVLLALIILSVFKNVSLIHLFDYSDLLIPLIYDLIILYFSTIILFLIYIIISNKENVI